MCTQKIIPLRRTGSIEDRLAELRIIEALPDGLEKERLGRRWYDENRPVALELVTRLLG